MILFVTLSITLKFLGKTHLTLTTRSNDVAYLITFSNNHSKHVATNIS